MIEVVDLYKEFRIFKRPKGVLPALQSLIVRNYEVKKAVDHISFSIGEGEMVGYIGSNGAGKSTTIKLLSGILVPTAGSVLVAGNVPYQNRKENAMQIGVVFGQRSQLNWDLPMEDTFQLYKRMYQIEDRLYKQNVERFTELMDMKEFLHTPVRQLSLGQKMRAEIAIAMLHSPKILYLDEPTIGMDVFVKERIRDFIRQLNKEMNTTVILTTHDMKDIEAICNRIIMIEQGQVIEDASMEQFKMHYHNSYFIKVEYETQLSELDCPGIVCIGQEGRWKHYQVNKAEIDVNYALKLLLQCFVITNIDIREEEVEETVKRLMTHNTAPVIG